MTQKEREVEQPVSYIDGTLFLSHKIRIPGFAYTNRLDVFFGDVFQGESTME